MAATMRQLSAISCHDVSMVVTAGAGTGKTFVLVEKYLNLIQDQGYRIRDVLALTFTDKAAAEMKERVRNTIADRLKEDPDNQVWKDAHEEMVIAPVMTFHSFCAQILREFAIEAGLDPGFLILDEGQSLAVGREAFETLIRRPPDEINEPLIRLLAQVEKYHLNLILNSLSKNPETFERFKADLFDDPGKILNSWEKFLEETRVPVIKRFFSDPDICDAISDFYRFFDIYRGQGDSAVRYLGMVCPVLQELSPDLPAELLHQIAEEFLKIRPVGNIGSKKIWDKDDLERFREAKACLIAAFEEATPYFSLYLERDSVFTRSTLSFLQDIGIVAEYYLELLRNIKRQANGLDFNDLIQLTRDFLNNHQDTVKRHIRPRYKYILVDEFQDTDPAQFDIITAITGVLNPDNRSLFIVGDPKQSIYLFRNADVTRFKEAQSRILNDCRGELISLDTSFRSCREVIGCVNHLFSSILASDEKPWEFGYEPIMVCDDKKASPGSITVMLPGKAPKGSERFETKEIEAGMVADLVQNIVSSGSMLITDREGVTRPAGYGDIAILIERRTHLSRYTNALSRKETPFYVHGGIGFYSRQEIYDLYSVLSFLLRPYDSAALFGVLRSPWFGFSDPVLYHLHHIKGAKRGWSLYERLKACAERISRSHEDSEVDLEIDSDEDVPSFSLSDQERIVRASGLLGEWSKLAGRIPVISLVIKIIRDSGILTVYGAMEQGEQQAANLTKLIGIIRNKTESGYYSLFDLVNDMTISISDEEREGEAALDTLSQTSVNIMTVHASKGLEFPVVILPDMGSSREGRQDPILSGDNPHIIGVKIPDPDADYDMRETPVYTALSLIQKEKEAAERKRLFYVGSTRARDHLVFCGKQPDKFFDSVNKSSNRIDWVCTLFGITRDIAEQGGTISFNPGDGGKRINVTVLTSPEQLTRIWAHEMPPDLVIPENFEEMCGSRVRSSEKILVKETRAIRPVSVTDLQAGIRDFHPGEEDIQQLFIPDSSHLGPDETGTLLHQVFSGKDPRSVLASYDIKSPKAETFCTSLYQQFLNTPIIRNSIRSFQELSFISYSGTYPLTGRIDRLVQLNENEWAVIDYKSGKLRGSDLQMNIYRMAAESLTKGTVKMYLYSMVTGEYTKPRYLSEKEVNEKILKYMEDLS